MPSEKGIAVKGRRSVKMSTALARLSEDQDDIYALYASGNARLSDDDLERLCGITPAMVYALREIAEGRVGPGAMAQIEAFSKFAEIGHRPAKGRAKPAELNSGKTVIFQINVAEIRPEVAAAEPRLVLDVEQAAPTPEEPDAPIEAAHVTLDIRETVDAE